MEQRRAPGRLVADATDLLGRSRMRSPIRPAGPGCGSSSSPSRPWPAASPDRRPPYLEQVRRCFDAEPVRRGDAIVAAVAGELDRLVPGRGDLRDRLASWDAGLVVPIERLPEAWSTGWSPSSGSGPRSVSVSRLGRVCASPSSATSPGRATTGTTVAGARGSTSTPTCRSRLGPDRPGLPRDLPRPPPRARLARGGPGRRAGRARGERPPHQHARMPHQRGPGRGGPSVRRAAGERDGPRRRAARSGGLGPGRSGRRGRSPLEGRARGPHPRGTGRPGARQRSTPR